MSDSKQLKPGDGGVPEQVYGQIDDGDYIPSIDSSDGYRVKLVSWENVAKQILQGKTIGGTGSNDIADNSSSQTWRNKTLIDPIIRATNGEEEEVIDEEDFFKLKPLIEPVETLMGSLSDSGYEDGARIVETVDVTPKQKISAILDRVSGVDNTITLTDSDLFEAAGIDETGKDIDVRSLEISAWTIDGTTYTMKSDWTAEATVDTGTKHLASLVLTMHDAETTYSLGIGFRLAEEE